MIYKSKRSRACDFDINVKREMLERDGYRCIFCGSAHGLTPAHYISRGAGGLGIIENGACVCVPCHNLLDASTNRIEMSKEFKKYLDNLYPDMDDDDRIYNRRNWLD